MNREELVKKAVISSDVNELKHLSNSPYMLTRRAVAKNRNTDFKTLETLSYDKVLNVSFVALKNPNCRSSRVLNIDFDHPCLDCHKDEVTMLVACKNCDSLNLYNQYN